MQYPNQPTANIAAVGTDRTDESAGREGENQGDICELNKQRTEWMEILLNYELFPLI